MHCDVNDLGVARDKDNHVAQKNLADAISDYKDAQAQLGATINHKDWPSIPNALSRHLRSLDTQLRGAGITIRWPTSHKAGRKISVVVKKKDARDIGVDEGPSSPAEIIVPRPRKYGKIIVPQKKGDDPSPPPGISGDDH